jgi:hypothetical protein
MMRSHRVPRSLRSFAILAAALLSACGGLVDPNAQPDTPGTVLRPDASSPSVSLAFSAGVPGGAVEALSQASIDDTATLYVVADWKNIPANGAEQLDLYLPNGTLYASLELPIAATERGDLAFEVLGDGTRRLTFSLHVWGTPIESLRMAGTWTAVVSLVGGAATASAYVVLR